MKLPETPPTLSALSTNAEGNSSSYQELMVRIAQLLMTDAANDRDRAYLHWDKLRFKKLPANVASHEDWWLATKLRRTGMYRQLPLLSKDGTPFVYWLPDCVQQLLHRVDQQASGRVLISEDVANSETRNRYLVSSLIEEAITSSQLEGASTTHKVAKAMLRENRQPRNISEKMIVNNYRAMSFIRDNASEDLTEEIIFELHRLVCEDTLDDPPAVGRLRKKNESVAVYDVRDNTLLHEPPAAGELRRRIASVCKFANQDDTDKEFLHPVIRSILLHFMIGYDHPFVDGNGRTARALFYWSMAHHGYWMMDFTSISSIIKKGPAKYMRAYLYSETDDNDTTYFIEYNLRVIVRALESLQTYLAKKSGEVQKVEKLLGNSSLGKRFNYRQVSLLSHAIRHPDADYTIESHRQSHDIAYPTSRGDLYELVELGLLTKEKIRKAFVFRSTENLESRLNELTAHHN